MQGRAVISLVAVLCVASPCRADEPPAPDALARDIFRELIEIDTTESTGSVTAAAIAMRRRFLDAGFADEDLLLLGPVQRKQNLVVRLRGNGRRRPVLLLGHLDVVAARREDWSTDPFALVEKDGFFYGRGAEDMKNGVAVMATALIRLKAEGFRPARDPILALTADEEGGAANGVAWLLANHRELIDAEFAVSQDDYSVVTEQGRPLYFAVYAAEKTYADYRLIATGPAGHSALPLPDNAIYRLAGALARLERHDFPFELNAVTRGYYRAMAAIESGRRAADMRAILQPVPDMHAAARLARDPTDRSLLHTTCVATRLAAGDANNVLPPGAEATVNCRVLPGHSPEEIRRTLQQVAADRHVAVRYIADDGRLMDTAPEQRGFVPQALYAGIMAPLETVVAQMWPGLAVVPTMSVGTSDASIAGAAGLPAFTIAGFAVDRDDDRAHDRDERIGVESFYRGNEFAYRYLKALSAD